MTDVEISDHAVYRYLQRVKGINMEAVRDEMRNPALAVADEFGCATVIGRHGERMIIEDGVVVTVLRKRMGKMDRRMKA